jgi:hypothetical protein
MHERPRFILGRWLGIVLGLAMALDVGSSAAQTSGELGPGARVRVNREIVGNVLSLHPDSLRLTGRRQESVVAVDVASIQSLEISTRRSHRVLGAVVGYFGGVAVSAALAEISADGDDNLAPLVWSMRVVPITVLIGVMVSGERWKKIVFPG